MVEQVVVAVGMFMMNQEHVVIDNSFITMKMFIPGKPRKFLDQEFLLYNQSFVLILVGLFWSSYDYEHLLLYVGYPCYCNGILN